MKLSLATYIMCSVLIQCWIWLLNRHLVQGLKPHVSALSLWMKNLVSRLFYLCYDPVVIVSLSLHLNSCLSMVLVHCPSHPPGNLKHDLSCWVVAELLMAMKTLSRIHLSQILTCMFYESPQLVKFIIRIRSVIKFYLDHE